MTAEVIIPDGEALLNSVVVVVRIICSRQRAANRRGGCSKEQIFRGVEQLGFGLDTVSIEALLCELVAQRRIFCTNKRFWVR